jgi:folate-binding protein YgfZ
VETPTLERDARALDSGHAYVELVGTGLLLVSGSDARSWLHDLVTTDVESLGRFDSRPSLLLSPTGRIRAGFHVLRAGEDAFLLAQPAEQPAGIDTLLAPYVLSSDVLLRRVPLRIFAVPGRADAPTSVGDVYRPSVLGGGFDAVAGGSGEDELEAVRTRLSQEGLRSVSADAARARRIRRGEPAFAVDLDVDSLPAESGWDVAPVTDRGKGCFLGQESVARVSNLGHPTRLVLPVAADAPLLPGDAVLADGAEVGVVTSATGMLGLARVRWEARSAPLISAAGARLRAR